jgi:hypothetical protein
LTKPVAFDTNHLVDAPATNTDLLAWFIDDERQECRVCRERAGVTIPHAVADFVPCLERIC